MTKTKLVALDVDGTLVRRDLTISPAVVRAVESLRDAGVAVAVVTGRCMAELTDFRRSFPWIRFFVVSNGATGFDAQTNTAFYENHLPLSIAQEIERESRRYPLMTEVYADGVSYVNRDCWEHTERFDAEFLHHASLVEGRVPVDDVGALLTARNSDIEKLYFSFETLSDLPKLRAFCERFPVDLVTSIHDGLEVNQKGVEKGAGLSALCDYLGIPPAETAAIGDGEADIAMFRVAGLSFAMENAKSDVKAAADIVAPDHDDDGAAWAISQILSATLV